MPIYEWYCVECSIKWDREYKMSDNLPKKTKCPKCKKLSERLFDEVTPVHFKGGGWSDPHKNMTHYKSGASDEIAKEMIKSTEKRFETGNQHYTPMYLDPNKWNKGVKESTLEKDNGQLRPLSEEGVGAKRKKSRKQTAEAYDKAGNETGPYNPNVKNQ